MPKYVCDFNQVTNLADNLISTANDLIKATNSYRTTINRDLNEWTGIAKDYFYQNTITQTKYSLIKANSYNCLGEYLKGFIQKIENLEEVLSSNKI